MIEVLDSLIRKNRNDIKQCLEKIKSLAEVLQPPMKSVKFEQVEAIRKLLAPSVTVDPAYLTAEFEVFRRDVDGNKQPHETVQYVCQVAYQNKSIFRDIY